MKKCRIRHDEYGRLYRVVTDEDGDENWFPMFDINKAIDDQYDPDPDDEEDDDGSSVVLF